MGYCFALASGQSGQVDERERHPKLGVDHLDDLAPDGLERGAPYLMPPQDFVEGALQDTEVEDASAMDRDRLVV